MAERLFHIIITSGPYAYRHVGISHSGSVPRFPDVRENPPVNLPGTTYGLWLQEGGAIEFSESEVQSVQDKLKKLVYETELIPCVCGGK